MIAWINLQQAVLEFCHVHTRTIQVYQRRRCAGKLRVLILYDGQTIHDLQPSVHWNLVLLEQDRDGILSSKNAHHFRVAHKFRGDQVSAWRGDLGDVT